MIAPTKQLSDIIVNPNEYKKDIPQISFDTYSMSPSVIVNDWLYLGNAQAAMNLSLLQKLEITHVLNVTHNICCFHIFKDIKYAQIHIDDIYLSDIFDYFEAACSFISECNPFYYHKNNEVLKEMNSNLDWKQPKILIHCAAGISRSSTIVIGYLIARNVRFNDMEQKKLKYISEQLNHDKKGHKNRLLSLGEAYYYVKSCRHIIQPNEGFIDQLEKFEMLYHNSKSTKSDIRHLSSLSSQAINYANGCKSAKQKKINTSDTQCTFCNIL